MYYTNVVIVLDYIHRETVLPSNSALESLYYSKDRSSILTSKREPIDLPTIFILNRQEIFTTVISLLKYKQVLGYTLEWPK